MASNLLSITPKFSAPGPVAVPPGEWLGELSVERYRPMLRLLNGSDLSFLRNQQGYSSRVAARLRRQRCRIFSGYLCGLEADFQRMCLALRFLISRSKERRVALAHSLAGQEQAFRKTIRKMRWQLVLHRWGAGNVDASDLMDLFQSIYNELKCLSPETRRGLAVTMVPGHGPAHIQR